MGKNLTVDPEIMDAFVAESREHLSSVEGDILALERGPIEPSTVNHLLRALHTVKGGAAFIGLSPIKELAHALESAVGRVSSGALRPGDRVADALLQGIDKLRLLIESFDDEEPEIEGELIALRALEEGPGSAAAGAAVPERGTAGGAEVHPVTAADSSVRISLSLLDRLVNLATELVLIRNQNMQAAEAGDREQLTAIAQHLNTVTSELQSCVMRTRMRPVGSVLGRYSRFVRDSALAIKKGVDLEIRGSDVELDKSIIEAIGDPLTHILRNVVDHGIEDPETRLRRGKSPRGLIRIRAFHQSGQVHIEVQDDGGGMDPERIKRVAVDRVLITPAEAQGMTDRDAFRLVFAPGLSTAGEVTELSGRGVGMDVVRDRVRRLGGMIEVASVRGEGTTFTIKLPLTLAIVPVLVVAVSDLCFAIPQVSIDEVIWLHGEETRRDLKQADHREVYWLRDRLLPILRLSNVLGIRETVPDAVSEGRRGRVANSAYILVVRLGETRYGLLVDSIVDTEEIVVKSLHDQLKSCAAYAGTTVLGDGRIAMILDVAGVAELGSLRLRDVEEDPAPARSVPRDRQTLLLFDVGGAERFALPLSLVARVEEVPVDRIQRANGREYLEHRGSSIPLVRLEHGLRGVETGYREDRVHVIITKVKGTIGLLAHRILDTVEAEADVDLETIDSPGIAGSALIDGRLTLLLDIFHVIEEAEPGWCRGNGDHPQDGHRVLLVEGSGFSTTLVAPYLRGAGLTVEYSPDGETALERLMRDEFDTVVCCIELPGMNGLEFARRVRSEERTRDLPLIAISALDDPAVDADAIGAGFDRFASKLDQGRLLRSLEAWCTGKTPVREG